MALEISTAGAEVSYAFEAESGVRPTTGYQKIPNIKGTPDINPEPSNYDVTDLSDTTWKRYIRGMKDPGGTLAFSAHNTTAFQAAWFALCYLSAVKAGDDLATWFCVTLPGLSNGFYFSAVPSALGVMGMETDSVAEVEAYVSTSKIDNWQTAPTAPAVYITPISATTLTTANSPLDVAVVTDVAATLSATSSATGKATVAAGTGKVTLTKVATGETYITVTTNAPSGRSAGMTVFKTLVA